MKSFPMFFRTSGRRVIVAGGGEQAAQKARLILKTDAQLVLIADRLDVELAEIVATGRATHDANPPTAATFVGAALAFIATGCPAQDTCLHALAQAARCPVNVVDQPHLCDVITPSIVDRDPVVVAIGTDATAPVLARQIKTTMEELLPSNLGGLAALAGRLRASVAQAVPKDQRRAFWRWTFAGEPRKAWSRGAERDAATMIKAAISKGGAPDETGAGSIALVGAGPGARDLLTLRAVQRLQEADVIYYDRLVDPDVLEVARRDAQRIFVGKHVGAHHWPQERINDVIVAEARKGKHVVRLKSGDPSVFGRAGEEIDAARKAGIAVEIVPGITAASAAAAAMGRSLTQRGVSNQLVLATGTGCDGDVLCGDDRLIAPGATTAFYMAARQGDGVKSALQRRGLPDTHPIDIAANVSTPGERLIKTTLGDLPDCLARENIDGGAILLVTWPHNSAAPVNFVPTSSQVVSLAGA